MQLVKSMDRELKRDEELELLEYMENNTNMSLDEVIVEFEKRWKMSVTEHVCVSVVGKRMMGKL